MRKREKDKKFNPAGIIGLVIALAVMDSDLLSAIVGLAVIIGPIVLIVWLARKSRSTAKRPSQSTPTPRYTPAPRQQPSALDDCPKPFCFHRDKGEHHVRKGREIDPWDRPDIDISKYQRRG